MLNNSYKLLVKIYFSNSFFKIKTINEKKIVWLNQNLTKITQKKQQTKFIYFNEQRHHFKKTNGKMYINNYSTAYEIELTFKKLYSPSISQNALKARSYVSESVNVFFSEQSC